MRKKYLLPLTALFLLAIILSACNDALPQAVAIDEKNDKCDICQMAVKDDQFATQTHLDNKKILKFDDIGCMFEWIEKNKDEKVTVHFVRDYHTKKWIPLDSATFAYHKDFKTPMAYGVLSFENEKDAQEYVKKEGKGKVMTYEELQKHSWERNKEMMEKMKQEHGHQHRHDEQQMDHHDQNHTEQNEQNMHHDNQQQNDHNHSH